jgi:hypothetical protein
MGVLDALLGAAGTAILQRTYMLQNQQNTLFGIPTPLAIFDAIIEENPEYTADVTQHPVEAGTEVTDHIQLKNPTLKIKGVMSNSPIDLSNSVANVLAGGLALVTSSQFRSNILNTGLQQAAGFAGAALLGNASGGGFLGGALDSLARSLLIGAFESKQIVDIVTKRQKYSSMAIQSLKLPRDSNTGYAVVFEIDLVQIRIVSPISTLLSSVAEDVVTSASGSTNLGSQASAGVSSATSSSAGNNSILRSILGK